MGRGQQENWGISCSSRRRSSAREMIVEALTPRASASAHRGSKVMGRSAWRRRIRERLGMPEASERPLTVMCRSSLRSRSSAAAAALRPVPGFVARVLMSLLCHIGHQDDGTVTVF
nr:MAG TPA: hypothetical protein [Caudoviricetes sp.]